MVSFASSLGFKLDGHTPTLFPRSLPFNYLTFDKVKKPLIRLLSDSTGTIKQYYHNIIVPSEQMITTRQYIVYFTIGEL
jgi:hypothetical protein